MAGQAGFGGIAADFRGRECISCDPGEGNAAPTHPGQTHRLPITRARAELSQVVLLAQDPDPDPAGYRGHGRARQAAGRHFDVRTGGAPGAMSRTGTRDAVMSDNRLVGIVSIGDMLQSSTKDRAFRIDQLVKYVGG